MANTTDKSILTAAGKALLAQLNAEEKPLIIDKMIFANVADRAEFPQSDDVVPTEDIVHQEQVEQRGRLSADSVIYSSTLTSDVGPFEFNWTGAYCSEYGVLVTIDHHALTPKTADEPGVAGNTLVRSVVLEYKDIAEITNIRVDASSWQYNATDRMKKMDSDVAQSIIDQNGKDWFIEDGFLVTPSGDAYNIKAGAGYVSGNRVSMEFDRSVQVPNKPSFIYIDAHREGTPTGEQVTLFDFVITAEEKDDYTDSSTGKEIPHFVCKIAEVLADGSVSDLRPDSESVKQRDDVANAENGLNISLASNVIYSDEIAFGVQSFAVSAIDNNKIYALSLSGVSTANLSTLHQFGRGTVMEAYESKSVGSGEVLGHQGLFCVNDAGSDRVYSTSYLDKRHVVSGVYHADDEFSDVRYIEVFDATFESSLSCTPSISKCGRYFIVQGSKNGLRYIREYQLATESLVSETIFDESLLLSLPVQGLAINGQTIYIVAGNNTVGRNKLLLKIRKKTSEIITYNPSYAPLFEFAERIQGSAYEPEGLTWIDGDLYLGIVIGYNGGRKTFLINISSPSSPVTSPNLLGNTLSSIRGIVEPDRLGLSLLAGSSLSDGAGMDLFCRDDSGSLVAVIYGKDGTGGGVFHVGTNYIRGPGGDRFTLDAEKEARIQCGSGEVIRSLEAGQTIQSLSKESQVWFNQTVARSTLDDHMSIGDETRRMKNGYFANLPSTTSDLRLKTEVNPIPDIVLDAWESVAWVQFKYKARIAEKGDQARLHCGVIAQWVIDAFAEKGLNAFDYALIRKVEWDDKPATYMKNDHGELVECEPAVTKGERLEILYDEAQSLELALMRRELSRLKAA